MFGLNFGRKPAPPRGPSVMGKGGGWVPPDNPDAVNDPMQAVQQPPQPMGQLGALVNPGGGDMQTQPYNPPPPQGGNFFQPQQGGNIADAGRMGQQGNFFNDAPPPNTGGYQPAQGGNIADAPPPPPAQDMGMARGGDMNLGMVQGPEGGAPPPEQPPQFGSVMGQHEWVNRGINPNGAQFDPRTGTMTPPRAAGMAANYMRNAMNSRGARRPTGMLGDLMAQRGMR